MSSGAIVALVVACAVGALGLLAAIGIVVGSEDDSSSSGTTVESTGGGPEPGPEPVDVPEGFTLLEGDGVSIAAPDTWGVLDTADVEMTGEELAEAFPDADPALVEQMSDALGKGAVLVAYDFGGGAFAANVNIARIPGEAPLAAVEADAAAELASLGGEVLATDMVDAPVGEVLEIQFTIPVTLPGGSSQQIEAVQLWVPVDGHTYIITVATDDDAGALAEVMIDTFRVE